MKKKIRGKVETSGARGKKRSSKKRPVRRIETKPTISFTLPLTTKLRGLLCFQKGGRGGGRTNIYILEFFKLIYKKKFF